MGIYFSYNCHYAQQDLYGVDVRGLVLNLPVGLKKGLDPVRIPLRLHTIVNVIIEKLQV